MGCSKATASIWKKPRLRKPFSGSTPICSSRSTSRPPPPIVHRFGLTSPTFGRAASILRAALRVFAASEANALAVKRQQWAFHLARVYGSADASNDEMFVRHTYLCQFAKILAYTASFGVQRATLEMEQIIDGRAF